MMSPRSALPTARHLCPKITFPSPRRPAQARAPHAWLEDGSSILDLFGSGFTLLRLGADPPDGKGLHDAAAKAGVPLAGAPIADPALADLYGAALVLVRPDGHVAWRGNTGPDDPMGVIERIRGASI